MDRLRQSINPPFYDILIDDVSGGIVIMQNRKEANSVCLEIGKVDELIENLIVARERVKDRNNNGK